MHAVFSLWGSSFDNNDTKRRSRALGFLILVRRRRRITHRQRGMWAKKRTRWDVYIWRAMIPQHQKCWGMPGRCPSKAQNFLVDKVYCSFCYSVIKGGIWWIPLSTNHVCRSLYVKVEAWFFIFFKKKGEESFNDLGKDCVPWLSGFSVCMFVCFYGNWCFSVVGCIIYNWTRTVINLF